jgi:5-methylcytosine-specific restriction endonuclease McrA
MQKSVDENNINPGEQLREFIKKLFPADAKNDSFISRIDYTLQADGELRDLVYNSTINYVLRRLIVTADYFQRKCKKEEKGDEKFITDLRAFLKDDMRFPEKHIGLIIALIRDCLDKRNAHVADSTKNNIRKRARDNNKACYICGGELDFDTRKTNSYNLVEVDHKWPQTMGGASDNFNLEVACSTCNGKKSDHIDASDFHYEKICLVSDENDKHFSTEMNRQYELALWAKREFKCSICEKSAADAGKLKFGRKNPNDSWHFLNIEIFCEKHHKIRG